METAQPDVAIHEMIKGNDTETKIETKIEDSEVEPEPEKSDDHDDFIEGSGYGSDDEDYIDDGHGFVWDGDKWEAKDKAEAEPKSDNENMKAEPKNTKEQDLQLDQQ